MKSYVEFIRLRLIVREFIEEVIVELGIKCNKKCVIFYICIMFINVYFVIIKYNF